MTVCVDASLIVRLLTNERGSDRAHEWFTARIDEDIAAPSFMPAEVASAIRKKIVRGEMNTSQGAALLGQLASLGIRLVDDPGLLERALVLADELEQPSAYDTLCLALAENERCECGLRTLRSPKRRHRDTRQ